MSTRHCPDPHGEPRYFYYRCPLRVRHGKDACPQTKTHLAKEVEAAVWGAVRGLLEEPEELRAGLEQMIELERKELRGNPDAQAKTWLAKMEEADRMRSGYQELAAKGLMTFDELGERLRQLEATKKTAERELTNLRSRQESIEKLENDRDSLIESLANIAPEALNQLEPEERHRIYKMMGLKVVALLDGGIEVSGIIGPADGFSTSETLS
jgi:hypothetical protein